MSSNVMTSTVRPGGARVPLSLRSLDGAGRNIDDVRCLWQAPRMACIMTAPGPACPETPIAGLVELALTAPTFQQLDRAARPLGPPN